MSDELQRRWRLILGAYTQLNGQDSARNHDTLSELDAARDQSLNYLYQHEYQRGEASHTATDTRIGSEARSTLTPVTWLQRCRKLFPQSTLALLQKQAIHRYGLTELLTDVNVLRQTPATLNIVQTLLTFRPSLSPAVMDEVRRIIREVCSQIEASLSQKIQALFSQQRRRHVSGRGRGLSDVDWALSIRRNLKHYQSSEAALVLERLYHYQRHAHKLSWDIFIVLDQSASMLDSLVHSAIIASIFSRVRALNTHLILFDTAVVDMTDQLQDPIETLLAVQLGGGTDIGHALAYTADQVRAPTRSILILISDFYEGGEPKRLYAEVQKLHEAGVKLLGLAALNQEADSDYCEHTAQQLTQHGMSIGAMTPDHLAAWVSQQMRQ